VRRLDGRLDALAVVLVLRERLHHAAATHTHAHTHRHNSRHLTYGHLSVDSCYPRDAMLARVLAMALRPCLCVRLSQVGVLSKRIDGTIRELLVNHNRINAE